MRFRNCCKFSCTSGSVCPRDWGERAWPRGPGDEDDLGPLAGYFYFCSLELLCFGPKLFIYCLHHILKIYDLTQIGLSVWVVESVGLPKFEFIPATEKVPHVPFINAATLFLWSLICRAQEGTHIRKLPN